jgi:hypothetical protein
MTSSEYQGYLGEKRSSAVPASRRAPFQRREGSPRHHTYSAVSASSTVAVAAAPVSGRSSRSRGEAAYVP